MLAPCIIPAPSRGQVFYKKRGSLCLATLWTGEANCQRSVGAAFASFDFAAEDTVVPLSVEEFTEA